MKKYINPIASSKDEESDRLEFIEYLNDNLKNIKEIEVKNIKEIEELKEHNKHIKEIKEQKIIIENLEKKYSLLFEEVEKLKKIKNIDNKEEEESLYYQSLFTPALIDTITSEIYVCKGIRIHGVLLKYLMNFVKKTGIKQQEVFSQAVFEYLLNYRGKKLDNLKEMEKYIQLYIKNHTK
jgi:hypothetical protein